MVDWGDGTIDSENSHVYEKAGEYKITVGKQTNCENCQGKEPIYAKHHCKKDYRVLTEIDWKKTKQLSDPFK